MKKHHTANERIKRQYFRFLKDAKGHSEATVDAAEKALSKATLHVTLTQLKRFFQWLALQPGYKSRLHYANAEYFNLSDKETRIATARREQRFPTLEQVKHAIKSMPTETEIERRNHALVAFTLLPGARDSAIASMKLEHVDLVSVRIIQDARQVKTKFSKTFTTYFFPVGEEFQDIVAQWMRYLREEKLWGNDDPLFPATHVALGPEYQFAAAGLPRKHWSNATPIRKIFQEAFTGAGLPYFNPHSLRDTLVQLGEKICQPPEAFKAWSQNLGHEKVLTTFSSYGNVSSQRQGEIIRDLAKPRAVLSPDADNIVNGLFKKMVASGIAGRGL